MPFYIAAPRALGEQNWSFWVFIHSCVVVIIYKYNLTLLLATCPLNFFMSPPSPICGRKCDAFADPNSEIKYEIKAKPVNSPRPKLVNNSRD